MRRMTLFFLLIISLILPGAILRAQDTGWCGYALIQGLPLLANQLAPLESITPDVSSTVNPASLFQYRFSLDHTKVIIEGCWKTDLTRDLVVSLLSQTVQYDAKAMAPQVSQLIQEAVVTGDPITTADAVQTYVDDNLSITYFAPGKSRDDQAAAVRDYLAQDSKEWNLPDDR